MERVIRKRIRHTAEGLDLAADINIVVSVNHGGEGDDAPQQDEQREQTTRPQSPDEGSTA